MTYTFPELLKRFSAALALAAGLALPLAGCEDDDDLGVGETADVEGVALVDPGDRDAEAADDAEVAGFTDEPNTAEGVRTAEAGEDAVTIQKRVPERIRLGTPLTYQISVTAQEDLKGLIVREELPNGFAFESSTPEAQLSEDGRTLTFRMNDLKSGQEQQIQIKGTPQEVGELVACTTYEVDRGVCTPFAVVNPQLRLTKQGPERAGVCEPVTYRYVIRNEGDTPAQNVVLYDRLPEGLMVVEGERDVKFEVGAIEPGHEVTREVQVMAEQPMQEAGSYAYAQSNLDEVRSRRVMTHFVAPDLEIRAQPNRPFEYIGKTATFNVTIRNTGEASAPAALVRLDIEGAGELAGINGQMQGEAQLASGEAGEAQEGAIQVTEDGVRLGTLKPGESRSFTVEATAEDAGRIRLIANATALCARTDRELATAQAAAAMQVRELSALQVWVVDKQDPVKVGDETVYELRVTNEGTGLEQNLQVSAQLPEGVSLVSVEGPTQGQAEGQNVTLGAVGELPAGESVTWYVRVRAEEAAGSTKFVAQVRSDNIQEAILTAEPTRLY